MNIDFNIDNYTPSDLQKFFKLSQNYSLDDVENSVSKITQKLLLSGNHNFETNKQKEIFQFLNNGRRILTNTLKQINEEDNNNVVLSEGKVVVNKTNIPYFFSNPSEYFAGKLNPLEKHLIYKQLCVDSLFRQRMKKQLDDNTVKEILNTNASDFTLFLPEKIKYVAAMDLIALELPRVWNDYSSKYNNTTMTITLNNVNGFSGLPKSVDYTITIPDGNYNALTIQTTINQYFLNYGKGLNFLIYEIDPNTHHSVLRARNKHIDIDGKFPYDDSSGNLMYYSPSFYFSVNFKTANNELYKNLGWILGFRQEEYIVTEQDTFSTTVYTAIPANSLTGSIELPCYLSSEALFQGVVTNYVYLDVNDYNNNYQTNYMVSLNDKDNFIGQTILARIPVSVATDFALYNNNPLDSVSKKRVYFGPVRIEKLTIRLLNKFGQVLDMMHNDYSFVLEFTQIYA